MVRDGSYCDTVDSAYASQHAVVDEETTDMADKTQDLRQIGMKKASGDLVTTN